MSSPSENTAKRQKLDVQSSPHSSEPDGNGQASNGKESESIKSSISSAQKPAGPSDSPKQMLEEFSDDVIVTGENRNPQAKDSEAIGTSSSQTAAVSENGMLAADAQKTQNGNLKSIGEIKQNVSEFTESRETRLLIQYGDCYDFVLLTQDLKSDKQNQVTEIKFEELSSVGSQGYNHVHFCLTLPEKSEEFLASLETFFSSDSDLLKKSDYIHLHFDFHDLKCWSEWSESLKSAYKSVLDTIQKLYGSKVFQCSFVRKHNDAVEYIAKDRADYPALKEIQSEVSRWSNLKYLDYSNCSILSVSGITFPDTLEALNVGGGYFLGTLRGVRLPPKLKLLDVSRNAIPDIDDIVFPTTLKTLNLMENKIYFLDYAEFPPNLENLDASCNRIESLRHVTFPKSLKTLTLSANPIECIKGAKFPEGIEHFDLSDIPNESMTGIKFPDSTKSLNLQSSMTNTRGLKLPPYVEQLNLACNGVNSINPLKLPNSIQSLYLSENNIKTLNKVVLPTSIKELYLGNNMITTLKNVQFPPTLEVFNMEMDPDTDEHEKHLTSLKDVYFPAGLRVLKLSYHSVKTIEGIEFPQELEELAVAYNDLRVFKNVKFGPKLRVLDLSGNEELHSLENVHFPESLRELMLPPAVVGNLPATIVERANRGDLKLTKSMPYTT